MNSFDYLNRRAPLNFAVFRNYRIAPRFRKAVCGLFCAFVLVGAAWLIQGERFARAVQRREALAETYAPQSRLLRRTKLYANRVRRLAQLDAEIRAAALSGRAAAAKLAAIASDLPAGVWLTRIAPAGADVVMEGRTDSLDSVSRAITSIARDPRVGQVQLAAADAEQRSRAETALRFTLRVTRPG